MKIPKGFNSWLDFYDYFIKQHKTIGNNMLLNFIDCDNHQYRMKTEELKAKCFDELNEKRISRELANKLLSKYHYIDVGIEDYDEIAILIEIMTLPEK